MQPQGNFDIAIIGGGTAGMAAAIRAALSGKSVVVFDAGGQNFDKPCGEGLMPLALRHLKDLGVTVDGHPISGISYVLLDGSRLVAKLPEPGRGVRRRALRGALWGRAQDLGVSVRHEAARNVVVSKGSVTVEDIRASWLIVAEGLKSQTVRHLGLGMPRSKTVRYGMRQHFGVSPWSDEVEVHWHKRCEAYVTPVDSNTINLAFLSQDPMTFHDMLELFPSLRSKFLPEAAVDAPRGAGPLLHRTRRRRKGRALIVGDAAGFVDALTGEGNALAFGSGIAAADAIVAGQAWSYEWRWLKIFWRYWIVTRLAVWMAVNTQRRSVGLRVLTYFPRLLQIGLNFLSQ